METVNAKRPSIVVNVELSRNSDGGVGVWVSTNPFCPQDIPNDVGAVWIGLCEAINEHFRARGLPNFDCLKDCRLQ